MIKIEGRPCPGSLMQSANIGTPGTYCFSEVDSELYSVMILTAGAWGSFIIYDGEGNEMFGQVSAFTGSFFLMAGAFKGIYCKLHSIDKMAPSLTFNWRNAPHEN